MYPIHILSRTYFLSDLKQFMGNPYDSMIKYVVDINKEILALGGEMHADAEKILLDSGSRQDDLWGANIYPWNAPIEIEYTSLINIRPTLGNRSIEIQNKEIINKVREITIRWIPIL